MIPKINSHVSVVKELRDKLSPNIKFHTYGDKQYLINYRRDGTPYVRIFYGKDFTEVKDLDITENLTNVLYFKEQLKKLILEAEKHNWINQVSISI